MFNRMFSEMKEPFYDKTKMSTLPPANGSSGMSQIQQYFGDVLPNLIYTNDKKLDINKLTNTTNARLISNDRLFNTRQANNTLTKDHASDLAAAQSRCESIGTGTQLQHLMSLAKNEDKKSRLRCGWVYDTNNPLNGRAAYGTKEGPFQTTATGTWMWNLDQAQQKLHKDFCSKVTNCNDIDAGIFQGICGWNQKAGKGVPIIGGQVAYPNDPAAACSDASLVTKGGSCVAVPKKTGPNGVRLPANVCIPRSDNSLPRDCLIQKAITAGCSDNGALVQGLKNGSDDDLLDAISMTKAYSTYQSRAQVPMNETALKTGKITVADALNDFNKVNQQASSQQNGGLQYAARDLCFNAGELEKFDFCTELQDNTIGPFTVDCLQKAYLKGGGQVNGSIYPSPSTLSYWNGFHTWGDVINNINTLKANTRSTEYLKQRDAVWKLNGIQIPPPPPAPTACTAALPTTVVPSRGKIIGTIDYAANFMLTFDITPKRIINNWASILHFTANGSDCCENGSRQPGIWFIPGELGLHVRINNNIGFNAQGVKLNNKSRIVITCKGDIMTLSIDDVSYKIYIKDRLNARSTVYCGDPWYEPAEALIENLCFTDLDAYDNTKVYKENDTVTLNARPYKLNQYVGIAGYSPDRQGDQLWKTISDPFTYQGCYRDTGNRALPTQLPNVNSVEACYQKAKAGNYKTFGLQYYGQCFAGNNNDWGRYGKLDNNSCGKLGSDWNNQVYTIN